MVTPHFMFNDFAVGKNVSETKTSSFYCEVLRSDKFQTFSCNVGVS